MEPRADPDAESRLDSWKEIAAYLGRSERTVRRWEEREQLPVHRLKHEKGSTVYAHKQELDAWWGSKKLKIASESTAPDQSIQPTDMPQGRRLPWMAGAAAVGILTGVLTLTAYSILHEKPESKGTVAVFSFSSDGAIEHLGAGIAETLVHYLSQASELRVRPFESVLAVRKRAASAADAARLMRADFVVTGNMRLAGDLVVANVALIDGASDAQIWGESYSVREAALAAKQRDVAVEIRRQILKQLHGPKFEPAPFRPGRNDTEDPDAFRAYLKGRHFFASPGHSQVKAAIGHLEEAVRRDPKFARAHALLAGAYMGTIWFADAPALAALTKAKVSAQKALELDESLGAAWGVLGAVRHFLDYDHTAAESDFRKASQLGFPYYEATILTDLGRFREALPVWERALAEWPGSLLHQAEYAFALHAAGRTESAVAQFLKTLEAEPNMGLARLFLGRVYIEQGRRAQAVEEVRRANELLQGSAFSQSELGYTLAVAGEEQEAEQILNRLTARRKVQYTPAYAIAAIHLGRGRQEDALAWLERAVDERNTGYWSPRIDPIYKPLRSHPRFEALLGRMKLN